MPESTELELAQIQLDAWRQASLDSATGKSYMIGGRALTRWSPHEIIEMINKWQVEVDRLKAGQSSHMSLFRMSPGDA